MLCARANLERVAVLRLIKAAFKQVEVDERIELDDARVLTILDKMVRMRQESIEQFRGVGRQDLVAKEEAELEIIKAFMPEPLSEAEVQQCVSKAIAECGAVSLKDMGKVMAIVKPLLQGRADLSKISAQVKDRLS